MIEILPIAVANGQRKADGLVQGIFTHRLAAAEQCREQIKTILTGIVGQLEFRDRSGGGQKVG